MLRHRCLYCLILPSLSLFWLFILLRLLSSVQPLLASWKDFELFTWAVLPVVRGSIAFMLGHLPLFPCGSQGHYTRKPFSFSTELVYRHPETNSYEWYASSRRPFCLARDIWGGYPRFQHHPAPRARKSFFALFGCFVVLATSPIRPKWV